MPSNIAHMLIAHKAVDKLKAKGVPEYAGFGSVLEDETEPENCRAYFNLGSLGPDLFCYSSLAKAAKDLLTDGSVQARGPEPWSYQMHSLKPNQVPLNLVEVIFRDSMRKDGAPALEANDRRKIAFVAGYLTHVAADQIIHPLVNNIAGPYYRDGQFRKTHRECEVFQDYFLYSEVYRLEEKSGSDYDFMSQDFRSWADCIRGATFRNTEDWFQYFLQRGLADTYGHFPTESEIEDSVDNLLLTLRLCKTAGPYRHAAEEYEHHDTSDLFRRYVSDANYIVSYRSAVELAVVYLAAMFEVYSRLAAGEDLTKKHRQRFLSIVQGADLSCPLEGRLLENATDALTSPTYEDEFHRKKGKELVARIAPQILSASSIEGASDDLKSVVLS